MSLKHFGRFGAPHRIMLVAKSIRHEYQYGMDINTAWTFRSDNGPHFIAHVIREFLHLIGVSHTLTLAYSKQENAIVERYNKEIDRHLRALTFENLSLTDYMSVYYIS